MATLDTIRRIRVEASERGLPQLEASLERYENTMEAVGVAMSSTDKKTQSAARAFEAMQKRVDPLHREMAQLAREFSVMGRAAEQGMGLAEQGRNIELMFAKTTAGRELAAKRAADEAKAAKDAAEAAKELAAAQERAAKDAVAASEMVTEALRKQRDMYRAANAPDAHVAAFRQAQQQQAAAAQARQTQLARAASPFDAHVGAFRQAQAARQAAEAEEIARSVARLRAEFTPTAHAAQLLEKQLDSLTKAEGRNAISGEEATKLRALAQDRLRKIQADHSGKLGQSLSMNTQLAYQLNDVISGLAMGQSPLTVLTQQGGQVYQAFADHPGGAAAGMKAFAMRAVALVTPIRALVGGLAGLGVAAAASWNSFDNLRNQTNAVLTGLGRNLNMTFDQFSTRMAGVAEQTNISTRSAVEFGSELARGGRLGIDAITELTKISKDFGATLGLTAQEGRDKLVQMFSQDPARGIEQLRDRFGLVNIEAEQYINRLLKAGRVSEATVEFARQLSGELTKASDVTGKMEGLWQKIAKWMSDANLAAGSWVDKAAGLVAAANKGIFGDGTGPTAARPSFAPGGGGVPADRRKPAEPGFGGNVAAAHAAQMRRGLENAFAAAADTKTTAELQNQLRVLQDVQRTAGAVGQAKIELADRIKIMRHALDSTDPVYRKAINNTEEFTRQAEIYEHQVKSQNAAQRIQTEMALEQKAAGARKLNQQADIAYEQEKQNLQDAGITGDEAEAKARSKKNVVLIQAKTQVEGMTEANQLQTESILREARAMEQASGERQIMLARLEAENELTKQGINLQDAYAKAYIASAEALARANQEKARASLRADLMFERDQMGRSDMDQAVASRLRGAGLPQDDAIAGQIKLNQQLEIGRDLAMDFGKGFVQDLRNGTEATEALTNALDRVANKLLDMAMDMAIANLFKGFSGAMGFGSGGMQGGAGMGAANLYATPAGPGFHAGGIVGREASVWRNIHPAYFDDAPRFHKGGMIAPDEVPIIARRGEGVFTPGQMAAMGGSNVIVNPVIENHTDSKVTTEVTKGKNGEVNIRTMIQQAAAEGASQPGNPMHRAVKTFGGGMPLTRR